MPARPTRLLAGFLDHYYNSHFYFHFHVHVLSRACSRSHLRHLHSHPREYHHTSSSHDHHFPWLLLLPQPPLRVQLAQLLRRRPQELWRGIHHHTAAPTPTPTPTILTHSQNAKAGATPGILSLFLFVVLPTLAFLTDHVLSLSWVRGRSMSPTLSPVASGRDCVLVWKWRVRERTRATGHYCPPLPQPQSPQPPPPQQQQQPLRRGEVVVFWFPRNQEKAVVKRVIGTEGDLVCLRSNASVSISTDWAWTDGMGGAWRERERRGKGREVRKGKEMGRGDIVGKKDIDVPGGFRRAIEVPKGHIWVEGDEGFHSGDSNDFGPIPIGLVTGRVKYIVWPPSRIGRVDDSPNETRGGRRAVVVKAEERDWEGVV